MKRGRVDSGVGLLMGTSNYVIQLAMCLALIFLMYVWQENLM